MAFESETLPLIRLAAQVFPQWSQYLRLLPVSVCVVDTCFLLQTCRARTHLPDRSFRTAFEEAIDSGVFIAVAPPEILTEFEANVETFAASSHTDLAKLLAALPHARERLAIIEPPAIESPDVAAISAVDPKDVPFARLYEHVGADWMLSGDNHWDVTSYRVHKTKQGKSDLLLLKNYARDAAMVNGTTATIGAATLVTFKVGSELFKLARRAPPLVQAVLLAAGAVAFLHPGARSAVVEGAKKVFSAVSGDLEAWLTKYGDAQQRINDVEGKVVERIPTKANGSRTLVQAALCAIAAADAPVSEEQLQELVAHHGYSKGKPNRPYLHRILSHHPGLKRVAEGKWMLRHEPEPVKPPTKECQAGVARV